MTLNYRVGALGFLHLGGRHSNLGLRDQGAALEFVAKEIEHFGGDPENVTVFGESAGAGSLCALLAMPSARGLFRRAIVQSAAPEAFLSAEEGAARARLVCNVLGHDPTDLAGLRSLDARQILAAQQQVSEPGPKRIGMFFAPVVDGRRVAETSSGRRGAGSGPGRRARDRYDRRRDASLGFLFGAAALVLMDLFRVPLGATPPATAIGWRYWAWVARGAVWAAAGVAVASVTHLLWGAAEKAFIYFRF